MTTEGEPELNDTPRDIRNKLQEETTSFTSELIGLIPAAGKGLRLGLPYPKELYPIIRDNRYKPIAQYVLENLTSAGIRDIVFVINETKHQLIGYFGSGSRFDCHISYVVQETEENDDQSTSPGLAYALDSAHHLTKSKIVCFGMPDTILNPHDVFSQVLSGWRLGSSLALGLFPITRPEKSGAVELDSEGGVIQIIDKPERTSLTLGWACMVWKPDFTEYLHLCVNSSNIVDFAEVMNSAIKLGMDFQGTPIKDGSYIDLGTYEDIMELERQHRAL